MTGEALTEEQRAEINEMPEEEVRAWLQIGEDIEDSIESQDMQNTDYTIDGEEVN